MAPYKCLFLNKEEENRNEYIKVFLFEFLLYMLLHFYAFYIWIQIFNTRSIGHWMLNRL